MIRRVTLSLNEATGEKKETMDNLIAEYLIFLQKIRELKKIDFTNIKTLVVEDLKNVKKGRGKKAKKGKKFSSYANRLLAHWAYHRSCSDQIGNAL